MPAGGETYRAVRRHSAADSLAYQSVRVSDCKNLTKQRQCAWDWSLAVVDILQRLIMQHVCKRQLGGSCPRENVKFPWRSR